MATKAREGTQEHEDPVAVDDAFLLDLLGEIRASGKVPGVDHEALVQMLQKNLDRAVKSQTSRLDQRSGASPTEALNIAQVLTEILDRHRILQALAETVDRQRRASALKLPPKEPSDQESTSWSDPLFRSAYDMLKVFFLGLWASPFRWKVEHWIGIVTILAAWLIARLLAVTQPGADFATWKQFDLLVSAVGILAGYVMLYRVFVPPTNTSNGKAGE